MDEIFLKGDRLLVRVSEKNQTKSGIVTGADASRFRTAVVEEVAKPEEIGVGEGDSVVIDMYSGSVSEFSPEGVDLSEWVNDGEKLYLIDSASVVCRWANRQG